MTAAAVATTAVLLFTPILLKAMITTNTGKKFQGASSCLDLFADSSQLLNTVRSCCRTKTLKKYWIQPIDQQLATIATGRIVMQNSEE
jgi:hypothetical protein